MIDSQVQESAIHLTRLTDLKPAPWNPRTIKDKRFKQLCAALQADPGFLWSRPILARYENDDHAPPHEIYAGNMRFRAASHLGWSEIPAKVEAITEQEAQERALRDNNQYGEWDEDILGKMLLDLERAGSMIDLLGFTDAEARKLMENAARNSSLDAEEGPIPGAEKISELIKKYGTAPGQVWSLGPHRLVIDDSTKKESVDVLFGHGRDHAHLLLTDPPYNVALEYDGHTEQDDNMTREDYEVWTRKWFDLWAGYAQRQIVTPGNTPSLKFWLSAFDVFHIAPWTKSNSTVEGKVAHWWCWEAILFLGEKGWGKKRQGDLFDFPITNQTMPNDNENGQKKNALTDYHPCPKPFNLWKELIAWYSKTDDIIADAFSGSGTTLIACQALHRTARVMEISPGYAAVSLERWSLYTGHTPERMGQLS